MYQMDREIHARKRRSPPRGGKMKTASMTASMPLGHDRSRGSLARYLPHAIVLALLFAVLFAASQGEHPVKATNTSLTHLGPH